MTGTRGGTTYDGYDGLRGHAEQSDRPALPPIVVTANGRAKPG